MLLTVVNVALLIASCASTNEPHPGFADQLPKPCAGNEGKLVHRIITHTLFNFVNVVRWRITKGQKVNDIGYQDGPKLMYGVGYSCDLEKVASELLEKQGQTQHTNYTVFNYTSTQGSSRGAKIKNVFEQMKADTDGRSTLSSSYVPYFGCAYSNENRSLRVLCVFSRDSNEDSSKHSSCSNDADCSRYEKSTCSHELCWSPIQEANQ